MRGISAVVQDQVGLPAFRVDGFVQAPPEFLLRLPAPGEDWDSRLCQSSGNGVLGGVYVAGCPTNRGTQLNQSFDQYRRLRIDMGASHNMGSLQGFLILGPLPQRHDARHLRLRDLDLPPSKGALRNALHAKVGPAGGVALLVVLRRDLILVGASSETGCQGDQSIYLMSLILYIIKTKVKELIFANVVKVFTLHKNK